MVFSSVLRVLMTNVIHFIQENELFKPPVARVDTDHTMKLSKLLVKRLGYRRAVAVPRVTSLKFRVPLRMKCGCVFKNAGS